MEEPKTAYCVKCRQKRPLSSPEAVFTKTGTPATSGVCAICGTKLFRMGRTAAHEGLSKPTPPPRVREGKLVIVESPAKARTIARYLGNEYRVMASLGHVRDLLRSTLSVDVDHDFEPRYRVPNEKRKLVKELAAAVDEAAMVYLATDLDREGEAIAWHIMQATDLDPDRAQRVSFHEITKDAILTAFANPTQINMDLVDAQQARRILDRLVGYKISPLLWDRVRNRLTAGRVQSVAVRLIVDREREIEAFVPVEYWTLDAELNKVRVQGSEETRSFIARLVKLDGKDAELPNQAAVSPILDALQDGEFVVRDIKIGERKRNPLPPFTTSTLQQTAASRLGFRPRRTMRVAQQLYAGLDLGEGESAGLITYMRTDSLHVSPKAQHEARKWIEGKFGKSYLPSSPPRYKTKAKGAQEAHEAIRPTSVFRHPQAVKNALTSEQYRLYQLIWQRFVASQMEPARYRTQTALIDAGPSGSKERPYQFRATGARLVFPGFLAVYADKTAQQDEQVLPPLVAGESLKLVRLIPEQHFTKPPPRYTEASLIRALEKHGIGRPSTYAPIISTIQQRGYVERDKGRALRPTETGTLVNDLLVKHFPEVLSLGFTADVEGKLDTVASGDTEWVPLIREFYGPFSERLAEAERAMPSLKSDAEPIGRDCPSCGGPLLLKWGRFGRFIACQNYPACKHTEAWSEKIGVSCPECGGDLVQRRSRRGRVFYGCSRYPTCKFTSSKRPIATPCPECGGLLVVKGRHNAQCTICEAIVKRPSTRKSAS